MNQPDALAAELDRARGLVADLRGELASIIEVQEGDPPDDEHDAEGSTVGFERARVISLLRRAEAQVASLLAAQARARDGSYGRCTVCGGPISTERLEALPTTQRCIACASRGS